jgi:multidrug efflux pump subunit AcrA (membrane-fusion protein)
MYRPNAALGAAISLALLLAACGQSAPPAPPAPQVTVANPVRQKLIDRDEYVGRFLAVDAVEIRARVSGYLEKIHFTVSSLRRAIFSSRSISGRSRRHSIRRVPIWRERNRKRI